MDNWQKQVYSKVSAFVNQEFEYTENEVTISLNQREAYIVMKLLEWKELAENPLREAGDIVNPRDKRDGDK